MKIKEYLLTNYELTEIQDIAEHGCSGGVGGLTYYHETAKFHDEHEDEIWDMIYQQTEDFGAKNMIAFIGALNGAKDVGGMEQFKNLLTWYAVDHISQEIVSDINIDEDGGLFYDPSHPCKVYLNDEVKE